MSYSLEDVRREYDRLDRICGVDSRGIELRLSRRAYKRLGCFRPSMEDQSARISLAPIVMDDEELFWETIRHEYAHALLWLRYPNERHGHDRLWRAACEEVGCRGQRLSSGSEKLEAEQKNSARYLIRCRQCGREHYYMRRGKVVRLLERGRGYTVRCAACGGELSLTKLKS